MTFLTTLPPHVRDHPVGAHDRDPDEQVARRAVQEPTGTGRGGGERPADRGARHQGVEGELLAGAGDGLLQVPQGQAGLGLDDQVTRRVLDQPPEPSRLDDQVTAFGRRAPVQLGAGAARHDGEAVFGGGAHQLARLRHARGRGHV